jgi:hypothetical protein
VYYRFSARSMRSESLLTSFLENGLLIAHLPLMIIVRNNITVGHVVTESLFIVITRDVIILAAGVTLP